MSTRKIKVGDWFFDSAEYDAESDVLYLSIGEPRPGVGEQTPEGHIVRFDETGEFCGVTLVGVREKLDKGALDLTLPRRYFPRRECLTGGELRPLLPC
jgi:uncharacterized protein YuzE